MERRMNEIGVVVENDQVILEQSQKGSSAGDTSRIVLRLEQLDLLVQWLQEIRREFRQRAE